MGHQESEQVELFAREIDGRLVDHYLAPTRIEAHRSDGEDFVVVLRHGHPAAQDRPHPGDQLSQPERFCHVVAGAELQAEHDVDLGVACCHHDDRHRLQAAHLLTDLDPGLVGEHDVEQHEIGMHAVEEVQRLVPVAGGLDAESLSGQARGESLTVGLLVVDDEHERSVVPCRPGGRGPAADRRGGRDCHVVLRLRQRREGAGAEGRREEQATTSDGGWLPPTSPAPAQR